MTCTACIMELQSFLMVMKTEFGNGEAWVLNMCPMNGALLICLHPEGTQVFGKPNLITRLCPRKQRCP